jgi:hypothetical protein
VLQTLGKEVVSGSALCRESDTRQIRICRESMYAEWFTLGTCGLCRVPLFAESGTRQSILYRVSEILHSVKLGALDKKRVSGSVYLKEALEDTARYML